MKAIAAKEAKNNFGELMDTAQREPITIEKHGRPVAVIMSVEEYQQLKIDKLKAKLSVGQRQLNNGQTITLNNEEETQDFFEDIKQRGRSRAEDSQK